MIINRSTIVQLGRSFRAISQEALQVATPRWERVAMRVPSTTGQNDYGWLADIPGMREWIGPRVVHALETEAYSIKNRDFELTVAVGRNDIEDDNIGIYNPRFQIMGQAVAYHPDELVFELLKRGFELHGFDGKPFFAANHKVGKKNVSNMTNGRLTRERFNAALATMQSLTNEHGRPLRVFQVDGEAVKPLLVVGPSNRAAAKEIVGLQTLPAGGDNPNFQDANILVLAELSGDHANFWMLLDVSKPVRPLILQRRKEPEFVAKDEVTDDNVFAKKEFIYGYDDRKNAGYGFWQLAFGSTGEVA